MNNKKMIVILSLSSFRNTLGIQDRKIKAVDFIPNKSNYAKLSYLEATINQLKLLISLICIQMKRAVSDTSYSLQSPAWVLPPE